MSMQLLPVIVYFLSQKALPLLGEDVIPKSIAPYLPMAIAAITFFVAGWYQQAAAKKRTAALIGTEAPDFGITLKDKSTTLQELIKETKLPTVVDFYQNF